MTTLTVQLSDQAVREAFVRAARRGLSTEEFIASVVEQSLVDPGTGEGSAVRQLSDQDVLAMSDYRLSPDEEERLSKLLDLNGTVQLTEQQSAELQRLMELNRQGLLRKSIGWAEAVRRNLRTPPRT